MNFNRNIAVVAGLFATIAAAGSLLYGESQTYYFEREREILSIDEYLREQPYLAKAQILKEEFERQPDSPLNEVSWEKKQRIYEKALLDLQVEYMMLLRKRNALAIAHNEDIVDYREGFSGHPREEPTIMEVVVDLDTPPIKYYF